MDTGKRRWLADGNLPCREYEGEGKILEESLGENVCTGSKVFSQ